MLPLLAVSGCAPATGARAPGAMPADAATGVDVRMDGGAGQCDAGKPMTIRFYDAGQGLAALVELPDGRRVLVDAGESPTRVGCAACSGWHQHVMEGLRRDLGGTERPVSAGAADRADGAAIDMLWITHQHSDHLGGAVDVLDTFKVGAYVDNGRDLREREVATARRAASANAVAVRVVDAERRTVPIADSASVRLKAVVPKKWPRACSSNPNDCSIGMRNRLLRVERAVSGGRGGG